MGKSLKFERLNTSFRGLMARSVIEFERYVGDRADRYHWAFVENPERIAKALEVLSEDLPEEDLAQVVTRLPYLILLFRHADDEPQIPVEATLAFLSVINQSGMITILRQSSDRKLLAPGFKLNANEWVPLLFMVGGVPDLDDAFTQIGSKQISYF